MAGSLASLWTSVYYRLVKSPPPLLITDRKVVQHIEEAHSLPRDNIQRAQQKMKEYYDRDASPVTYEIGQRVWVYTPKIRRCLSKKLSHNWHGPPALWWLALRRRLTTSSAPLTTAASLPLFM